MSSLSAATFFAPLSSASSAVRRGSVVIQDGLGTARGVLLGIGLGTGVWVAVGIAVFRWLGG